MRFNYLVLDLDTEEKLAAFTKRSDADRFARQSTITTRVVKRGDWVLTEEK